MKNFMLIPGLVLVLLSCATFKSSTSFDVSQATTSNFSYKDFKYELLKNNDKIEVKFSSDIYKFDFGKNYYAMYKLPDREDDYNILLRSYVFRSMPDDHNAGEFIFYPIIKVLDEKFNFKSNIITEINIDEDLFRKFITHKIPIKKDDKYIIIHTDSSLSGKPIKQITESFKDMPINVVGIEENNSNTSMIKFAPIGEVEILTPYENHKDVFIPPSNLFFEMGVSYGGKRIASVADQKDDIKTGSGIILSLGYAFRLPFHPRFTLRTIGGYKYDSGKTEYGKSKITAFSGEIIGVYSFNMFGLGIGYCSHLAPKFSAKDLANDITFKNAFGPSIIFEIYSVDHLTGGVKYILMDYVKKSNAEKINANQIEIYIDFYYNFLLPR